MDELRAITTFVRAAELGSFNRAAQAQGTTAQAVSKSVRQLEQHLGVRLFHRTTRKSSLTEDGERLLESARDSMQGLTSALNEIRSAAREDAGLIRINAAGATGHKVILPLIAEFRARYPNITFDLVLEDGATDTVRERIDLGFKAGNAPTAQVVSRPPLSHPAGAVCKPRVPDPGTIGPYSPLGLLRQNPSRDRVD